MSEDIIDKEEQNDENTPVAENQHSDYRPADTKNESVKHQLSGMYQNWFLDYASYVILERAVPHINDGLKPVQRRILHSMKRLDDGRYNKVANIVGHTMQFHPHGDASIGDHPMANFIRWSEQRAYHTTGQVSTSSRSGSGRHCRRAFFKDSSA